MFVRTRYVVTVESGVDTELRGMRKSLAPGGNWLTSGGGVPHWYKTYVSCLKVFTRTCTTHQSTARWVNSCGVQDDDTATLQLPPVWVRVGLLITHLVGVAVGDGEITSLQNLQHVTQPGSLQELTYR